MKQELQALAEILAEWINPAPGIPGVYLFGSRVRGDHRPDSDVDVRLYLNEWTNLGEVDLRWWGSQNETDFADLKARLPGTLHIHRENQDGADPAILEERKKPVLAVGRVICVWTPPRPGRRAVLGNSGPPAD